ncbi:hypothetical protein CBR_g21777 [Chara braunii]|uniref:Uncharacterized protein n=1 Tax=Chara braunii TaxID=69332 RepID=A0A388JUP3_CHABU|nr:hypothetical protein CBR_g21777 [Chara braunii]|eukprot:GBG61432.1 hypothetical protein CBR_g21777 [Chara braunii]
MVLNNWHSDTCYVAQFFGVELTQMLSSTRRRTAAKCRDGEDGHGKLPLGTARPHARVTKYRVMRGVEQGSGHQAVCDGSLDSRRMRTCIFRGRVVGYIQSGMRGVEQGSGAEWECDGKVSLACKTYIVRRWVTTCRVE